MHARNAHERSPGCTRAQPYAYAHSVLSPPSHPRPCDAHHLAHAFSHSLALVQYVQARIHTPPRSFMYGVRTHACTHVHSPSSTCPPTFTFTFMATLVPHASDHPQVRTITLMPTSHPSCIHLLVPHARTRCLSFWFVFLSSLSFILFYLPFPCIYHLEF